MGLAEDLRLSVYQTALQGKLTEQFSSDSSVEKLIKRIQSIKKKMIADGKIKREKKLPPVDDEVLFDIPDNWKWVRMQSFLDVRDGTHDSPKYVPEGVPFVTSKNISKGYLDFSNINYITQEDADRINQRSLVEDNDILLAMIGSIGNPVKVKKDREFAIKNMALVKAVPDSHINMDYVLLLLKYMQVKFKFDSSGGVQNFVSLTYLREFQVPLPPIEEQQRIVDRVDELMEQIDEYAKIEQKLISLKESFSGDLRSAILQAAMQGKLTEQFDTDSDVRELISICKKTISTLIEKKEIRNRKLLPQIASDEIPFGIPENWCWIRLGDVCTKIVDGDHNPPTGVNYPTEYLMLSAQNINADTLVDLENVRYLTEAVFVREDERTKVAKGDIFFTIVGSMGRSCIFDEDINVTFQRSVSVISTEINNRFLKYVLDSPHIQQYMLANATGTAQKGFYLHQVESLLVPLPPIEEQQRIVERLDALLPLCESVCISFYPWVCYRCTKASQTEVF